jgi:DNA-binding SARP family transcriptional activator
LTVDAAIEGLWPGADPEVGRNRLHGVLLRLRRGLGQPADGPISCTEGIVRLEASSTLEVDAWTFERAAEAAARPHDRRAATALYTGDLLSEQFAYDDTVTAYRRFLRRTFVRLACSVLSLPPDDLAEDDRAELARRCWRLAPDDEELTKVAAATIGALGHRAEAAEMVGGATVADTS